MKFNIIVTGIALSFLWTSVSAQSKGSSLELIFTQPVGGVYVQDWFVQKLGSRRQSKVDFYVVGDGKLGDFFGVLSIDCQEASNSSWLATGDFLSPERVPIEAIYGVRKLACSS